MVINHRRFGAAIAVAIRLAAFREFDGFRLYIKVKGGGYLFGAKSLARSLRSLVGDGSAVGRPWAPSNGKIPTESG